MFLSFVRLLCFVLLVPLFAIAQQPGCGPTDITIGVIRANGDQVEGLSATDFAAKMGKQSLPIESATYNNGPRRILLVIDGDRRLSAEARKAQVEFASAMVSSAQEGDSFALVTARGVPRAIQFGADRAAVLQAINESVAEPKDQDKQPGVLDAVTQGVTWFGEPRLGDSVVILAVNLEGNHKANYKEITRLLEEHKIRLFGVALGHLILTNQTASIQQLDRSGFGYRDPGMPMYNQDADANFYPLSLNSGGYIVQEDTMRKYQEFKVTELKKKELQKTAMTMAASIDKFYALRLSGASRSHAESWIINLSAGKLQAMPDAHILYPHELAACVQSASK